MPILVDGASDPRRIIHNGYNITRVTFNGVEVWPCFPSLSTAKETLSSSSTRPGGSISFNNLSISSRGQDTVSVYAVYAATISLDLTWSRYVGVSSSNTIGNGLLYSSASKTGIPSGFSYDGFDYGTVNLNVAISNQAKTAAYRYTSADFNVITHNSGNYILEFADWASFRTANISDIHDYWVGLNSTGIAGQRSGLLYLRKS